MLSMGWSRAEEKQFNALLASHHTVDIRIQLLDLSHNYIADLSKRLLAGKVDIDATADVTRAADLDLLDPHRALHLDSDSPDDGALYMDRMLRIVYGIISPDGTQRFYVPIFTGPISAVERNGAVISVEAHGKEVLGLSLSWRSHTFKAGMRIVRIIRGILTDLIGENRYQLPVGLDGTAKRDVSINIKKSAFEVAHRLAHGVGYQLFYDGRGVARMRKRTRRSVYTFRSGKGGTILKLPNPGFDSSAVINAVQVLGAKPKNATQRIKVRITAPRNHPLSPWRLGRNGVPRFIPETIDDDSIKTTAEAVKRGKERLHRGLLEASNPSFDCIPNPRLEPLDTVRLMTHDYGTTFVLKQFTIPLIASDTGSIGYVKKTSPNARAIRGRRRR